MGERLRRKIINEIKVNPKKSAPKIASVIFKTLNVKITPQTVRNVAGYHGRVARRKCYVSEANKKKRLAFAIRHTDKLQSYWNKVIWSDESKFEIFSSKRREKVWRKSGTAFDPRHLAPTVKHGGGSVMVWGCMTAAGPGKLIFIDGIMGQYKYRNILQQNLLTSARQFGIEDDFIFQHDNDPKHTARSIKQWLSENGVNVMEWPAQSPDINPIEHLWEHLDRKIRENSLSNLQQLKNVIQDAWNNIPASVTKKLVDSLPNRLEAIRKSKGNPTKY